MQFGLWTGLCDRSENCPVDVGRSPILQDALLAVRALPWTLLQEIEGGLGRGARPRGEELSPVRRGGEGHTLGSRATISKAQKVTCSVETHRGIAQIPCGLPLKAVGLRLCRRGITDRLHETHKLIRGTQ
jgi:hypothetical protein